jgi:hypothetical protein
MFWSIRAKPPINHLRAAFPDARYAGSPPDAAPGRSDPHRLRITEDDLKAIYAPLAGLPTYKQLVKMALLIAFVGAVLHRGDRGLLALFPGMRFDLR